MPTEADTAIAPSPLTFLLSSGGTALIASGLFFSLWAIGNVFKPPRERWILAQVMLSLFPGVFALFAIYVAAAEFTEMAMSQTAPKPAELAAAAGRAMSYGFVGLLSTIVPMSCA